MTDVLGSDDAAPRGPRGRRGWWWVAVPLVLAALVYGALRPPGGSEPAASPSPPAETGPPGLVEESDPAELEEPDSPPRPAPRLSAPPGPRVRLVVAEDQLVSIGGRVVFRTERGDGVASFTPLGSGFAAVVVEDPYRTANPTKLVVFDGTRTRRLALDEDTTVLPDATEESFLSVRPGAPVRRHDRTGRVLSEQRVPGRWQVAAGTVAGLVVFDDQGGVGLLRDGRVETLATRVGLVTVTPTHAAWVEGCAPRCDVVVRDLRSADSWSFRVPRQRATLPHVTLSPRGDAVALVGVLGDSSTVYAVRRGEQPVRVAGTPEGTAALGYYDVDWVEGDRVAVFDVADTVEAFVYDLRTRRLTHAGSYVGEVLHEVYATPL